MIAEPSDHRRSTGDDPGNFWPLAQYDIDRVFCIKSRNASGLLGASHRHFTSKTPGGWIRPVPDGQACRLPTLVLCSDVSAAGISDASASLPITIYRTATAQKTKRTAILSVTVAHLSDNRFIARSWISTGLISTLPLLLFSVSAKKFPGPSTQRSAPSISGIQANRDRRNRASASTYCGYAPQL